MLQFNDSKESKRDTQQCSKQNSTDHETSEFIETDTERRHHSRVPSFTQTANVKGKIFLCSNEIINLSR